MRTLPTARREPGRDAMRKDSRPAGPGRGGPARVDLSLRLLPPAAGCCALAATLLPAATELRIAPVAVFLLAGPGAALVRLCRPVLARHQAVRPAESWDGGFERDSRRLEQLALAVSLSVSASVLCATALLAVGAFSGLRVLLLLTALTAAAACSPKLRVASKTVDVPKPAEPTAVQKKKKKPKGAP
ncbi:hypothetical protein QCN29_13825 [Streptomyces sp. HNM0663]|uniref:Integral membrane protein n=1 Tax=Streptomyces chengmaiensis TaxID=3040919 RepID=A0ABT6HNL8_9ACTN|nr:hypothetical protein [Streptomyces chengmaiensis]MDH2389853.1 hypothetical protein [Streptomyces chengmaiensis]